LQLILAVSFFFLGIVLAMLSLNSGGVVRVIVAIVAAAVGIGVFVYALWLGIHYYVDSKSDDVTLLKITSSKGIEVNPKFKMESKDGQIVVNTGRYEVKIRDNGEGT
jgi:hypothetical protein